MAGTESTARPASGGLALVYRGPAALPGCPESVARLLRGSHWNFDVRFVGPDEGRDLSADTLRGAAVYAQPGGATLRPAWRALRAVRQPLRDYVHHGGRYLGFCLGAYLAGRTPGFGLLPGDTEQYIRTAGATTGTTRPTIIDVTWRGTPHALYFQDGATFVLDEPDEDVDVDVLARYPNGEIAALSHRFGSGRVAVVGPHPEATTDWFADTGLRDHTDPTMHAGHDLIDTVMR
ncbi:BPL-N domain-containing protein [Antrihabitans cavernicola]|uniref:Biotin-protein ligase N-terminal domain-containing protein n=1 Tax=Antrihabitans cavernicola TaxID=2495913 RepID=A0A5A7S459_9NOCA|nr:BPL-N domain-containing protein [Spelaeibacter cavernicola]KAA0017010.1 hypothetical protein FOY51_25550 [Spelaeibacter cavernicola]